MRKLELINNRNQVLDLLNNKDKFILVGAEALHGIDTDIIESETPYADGTIIDSVKALPRGIELRFKLRGNVKTSIDYLTSIVKSKQYVTLREVEGDRDLTIKGIVTIPPYSRMEQSCEVTISIYCNQPYWETAENIAAYLSEIFDKLYFPMVGLGFLAEGRPFGEFGNTIKSVIDNNGDTTVGMIIKLTATGDVVNPKLSCDTGDQKGWYMALNLALKSNDEVVISTVKNNKYIRINGLEEYNGEPIISKLEFEGNDWLQLEVGENIFYMTTANDETNKNVNCIISYKGRYE